MPRCRRADVQILRHPTDPDFFIVPGAEAKWELFITLGDVAAFLFFVVLFAAVVGIFLLISLGMLRLLIGLALLDPEQSTQQGA